MAEIAKNTDLTKTEGEPSARAEVRLELERFDINITLPRWLGGKFKITTRTRAGAALICSIAALLLALAGGAVSAIAVAAAGMTGWPVLVAALATPPAYFGLAYIALAHMRSRRVQAR